jgi:hypothetical protein
LLMLRRLRVCPDECSNRNTPSHAKPLAGALDGVTPVGFHACAG